MCHICWLDKIYSRVVWVSLYVKIKVSCLGKRVGENLRRGFHGRKGILVNLYHLLDTFLMHTVLFISIGISALTMLSTFSQRHFPKRQLPNGSSPCEISQVATFQVCHSRSARPTAFHGVSDSL